MDHLQQMADQRIFLDMKKKYRTIEQEALICSYQSTDQYQFDYKITTPKPMDEFEQQY